ncbi:hypothetical protein G7046_g1659 [Stylonectria norvegica]|nr:hypothetical protein G7046_g1659 [Stylonectria norvegica]
MATVDDAHISVRFKHGIHTVFLFIDALAPFANTTSKLVEILRERYPNGLTTSIDPPKTTTIPEDAKLAYGILKVANDPSKGWKTLKTGDKQVTATKLGVKNNMSVAFAVIEDEDDAPADFEVEWPREDEEQYEAAP